MEKSTYYATGKRKSAISRTWITPGSGQITVNDRPIEDYFKVSSAIPIIRQPLAVVNALGDYDIVVRVKGGGPSGQAGAIRHGITRALISVNPDYRTPLKRAGFVTRDPRTKERKKYGQRGARARFQFSTR